MQKTLTIIYTIATAALAIVMTIMQIQPARALINAFTTFDGREYYIAPVVLITWLILLMPMLIVLVVTRVLRGNKDDEIPAGRTGIVVMRKKAFQSAMVGVPVYINDQKVAVIDNGKKKFFALPSGSVIIHAGNGKQVSNPVQITLADGQQQLIILEFIQVGLGLKCMLIPM